LAPRGDHALEEALLMKIGDLVALNMPCLRNPIGAVGVCYETYELCGPGGASFIFENGNYDGFSKLDQEIWLTYIGQSNAFTYNFTNVMTLSRDFEQGVFAGALDHARLCRADVHGKLSEEDLRSIIEGHRHLLAFEKEWCLHEIANTEGLSRDGYEGGSFAEIARGVLHAWLEQARGKGCH
jgi:hypothetical protein